jgi:hypothetical protein
VAHHKLTVLTTKVGQYYDKAIAEALPVKRSGLGELAIQEVMSGFALEAPPKTGVPVRGPQGRARQLPPAGLLPHGVDTRLLAVPRAEELDNFCCRSRAPRYHRGPPVFSDPVPVVVTRRPGS